MAASLLQLLRMQPLKSVSWGVLRNPSVASLCTRTEDPAKTAKKAKTASKTTEAPDERATLLAYKTPVAFPLRFSKPEVLLAQSADVADQVASVTANAETVVGAPASTSDLPVTANNKSADPDSTSSSSSDSDSDSDSDSEDEKSEDETEKKSVPPDQSESAVEKEDKVRKITKKLSYTPFSVSEALPHAPPAATLATTEAVQAPVEAPSVSSEVRRLNTQDSAQATSTAVLDAQTQTPAKAVTEPTTSENTPADVPIETTHTGLDVASAEHEATLVASAEHEATSIEVTAENTTEICTPVDSAGELVDRAPVLTEAVEEKLQAEFQAEPSPEAAAVPPPEPEEPFDNSTYKNYQHHSYTPYTFVDQDVEMAKFRLPQPSSGRPSPRH
ncbi:cell surface glycoprotein 1 [Betta splendens]|uniref:Cell surface glycoprotein 1 n=1 Tax=Betta splendens TaxID=158456 RepID=A0A6P7LC76_BETSP|nr:cell surface glycoprotein 1 [Betta splendens]XP_028992215.1 cell surface glycoprotein 1 [Betta splendens]